MSKTIISSALGEVFEESAGEYMRSVAVRKDFVFSDKFNKKMKRILRTRTNPFKVFRIEHHALMNTLSVFAIMAVITAVGIINFRHFVHLGSNDDIFNSSLVGDSSSPDSNGEIAIGDIGIDNDMYRFVQCGVPGKPNEYIDLTFHDTSLYRGRDIDGVQVGSCNDMAEELKKFIGSDTEGPVLDDSEFGVSDIQFSDNETFQTIKFIKEVKSKDGELIFKEYEFGQLFIIAYVYNDDDLYLEDQDITSVNVSLDGSDTGYDVKKVYFKYDNNGQGGEYTYFCPVRYGKSIVLFTCRSTGAVSSLEDERYTFVKLISAII